MNEVIGGVWEAETCSVRRDCFLLLISHTHVRNWRESELDFSTVGGVLALKKKVSNAKSHTIIIIIKRNNLIKNP